VTMKTSTYGIVGVGGRSELFINALTGRFKAGHRLLALCDTNVGRLELWRGRIAERGVQVRIYEASRFDTMLRKERPDVIIVCSVDSTHDRYIVRALRAGCNVITEKPMAIDAPRCRRIVRAAAEYRGTVRVTFNYRYSPPRSQVKELLDSGVIGAVRSVDFHWMLDTRHGADYFRRWHRNKRNSGGLLVHKAMHHFDLVNWWIGATPVEVYAQGKRDFYTPRTAEHMGLRHRGERCATCPELRRCPFALRIAAVPAMAELYLRQESHDGYIRDRCVFSESSDIEDWLGVQVRYSNDVRLTYSLCTYAPWEGYTICFNGTAGRLEHQMVEGAHIIGDGTTPARMIRTGTFITVYPHFRKPYTVPLREATGGHGGGDDLMLDDIFAASRRADPLVRIAGIGDGAWSILTGIAANRSIATGRPVRADRLVAGIPRPGYLSTKPQAV